MAKRSREEWVTSASWIDAVGANVEQHLKQCARLPATNFDWKGALESWHRDGVVIFEQCVDFNLIDGLLEDVDEVLRSSRNFKIRIDGNKDVSEKFGYLDRLDPQSIPSYNLKLCDLHEYSRHAVMLAMSPQVVDFLSLIFQAPPALLQSLTFQKGSEQPLHQDFPYVYRQRNFAKLAAAWIPLEDIQADSGPLEYFGGSHQVEKLGFFDWGQGAINQYDRYANKEKFTAYEQFLKQKIEDLGLQSRFFLPKKGDVLIWHGALIHGGTRIQRAEATRKSFVCHYTSLDGHWALENKTFNGGVVFNPATGPAIADHATPSGGHVGRILRRVASILRG